MRESESDWCCCGDCCHLSSIVVSQPRPSNGAGVCCARLFVRRRLAVSGGARSRRYGRHGRALSAQCRSEAASVLSAREHHCGRAAGRLELRAGQFVWVVSRAH